MFACQQGNLGTKREMIVCLQKNWLPKCTAAL